MFSGATGGSQRGARGDVTEKRRTDLVTGCCCCCCCWPPTAPELAAASQVCALILIVARILISYLLCWQAANQSSTGAMRYLLPGWRRAVIAFVRTLSSVPDSSLCLSLCLSLSCSLSWQLQSLLSLTRLVALSTLMLSVLSVSSGTSVPSVRPSVCLSFSLFYCWQINRLCCPY